MMNAPVFISFSKVALAVSTKFDVPPTLEILTLRFSKMGGKLLQPAWTQSTICSATAGARKSVPSSSILTKDRHNHASHHEICITAADREDLFNAACDASCDPSCNTTCVVAPAVPRPEPFSSSTYEHWGWSSYAAKAFASAHPGDITLPHTHWDDEGELQE